ncbi:hypothetical protein ACPF3S_003200 [Vibrio cholerae]|uniref:Uncharacterized protein n=1 Tax=Vibrio cholerae TaxID=666 RepID=A0A7Z7VLR1_VIBCL|nr:hypothetical protein [Vibrio cholerae]EGR5063499.1 hypothetical protein [Vibrio cholerae]EII3728468.1 hypothetical protein [Vibrio cholerae]EKF9501106.1 hypothetical protein [Vibrio cholerae]ELH0870535.1 hypothetical protein [Vibrio cholerae]EMA3788875.1 hypothetical protein [Vibrio cholerae]
MYYIPETRDTNAVYVLIFAIAVLWMFFTYLPAYLKSKRAQEAKELSLAEESREQQRHEVDLKRQLILNEYLEKNPKEALAMLGKSSAFRSKPAPRRPRASQEQRRSKNTDLGETGPNRSNDSSFKKGPSELRGKLIDHGRARYKNKKNEKFSYFVTLDIDGTEQTFWGLDLKSAIEIAVVELGDTVLLTRGDKKSVTVESVVYDENGNEIGKEPVQTYRQQWNCTKVS